MKATVKYNVAKIRETGVRDFQTILEVQPAYKKTHDALRREYEQATNVYERFKKIPWPSKAEERKFGYIKRRISKKTGTLLEEHLRALGFPLEHNGYTGYDIAWREGRIEVKLPDISLFSLQESPGELPKHYKVNMYLSVEPRNILLAETVLKDYLHPDLKYISDGLRLIFPRQYNGVGIPAVRYDASEENLQVVPLSRLPQVREHIEALGKSLQPHVADLRELRQEMKNVSSQTESGKRLRKILQREYLYTLLDAMGGEIK